MAQGDEDAASPTTIILNRIKAQGLVPNADNIRRTVMAMRQSGETVTDPGSKDTLRLQGVDDDTRGSVAGKVEPQGNQGNAGNVDTRSGDQRTAARQPPGDDGGSPNTSAQPTQSTPGSTTTPGLPSMPGDDDYSLGRSGLGGIILGGLPAAYAAYKGMTGGGLAAGGGGAPTVDIAGALPPPPLRLGGPPAAPEAPTAAPGSVIPMGDQSVSPMESAMQKAIGGPQSPLLLGAPPPAAPIALPDQSSGPAIPMPPPEAPSSVGGAAARPQGRPTVTIDTSPQLSGRPPPFNPIVRAPMPQPNMTIQTNPQLSGRPPPIEFGNYGKVLSNLGRFIR